MEENNPPDDKSKTWVQFKDNDEAPQTEDVSQPPAVIEPSVEIQNAHKGPQHPLQGSQGPLQNVELSGETNGRYPGQGQNGGQVVPRRNPSGFSKKI